MRFGVIDFFRVRFLDKRVGCFLESRVLRFLFLFLLFGFVEFVLFIIFLIGFFLKYFFSGEYFLGLKGVFVGFKYCFFFLVRIYL